MTRTLGQAFARGFLGSGPDWYKLTIVGFLVANPILTLLVGPTITGWILLGEFIFTLAMALRCYPLQPGGLLAVESVLIGLTIYLPGAYGARYPGQAYPAFDNTVRFRLTNKLEEYKVKVALIGDSALEQSVDGDALSKALNTSAYSITVPGSSSPSWYLILKNIILVRVKQ